MNIKKNELFHLLTTVAELGAKNALIAAGIDKTEINLAEAYRRFSRKNVDAWIKGQYITPVKRGASTKIKLIELENVSMIEPITAAIKTPMVNN